MVSPEVPPIALGAGETLSFCIEANVELSEGESGPFVLVSDSRGQRTYTLRGGPAHLPLLSLPGVEGTVGWERLCVATDPALKDGAAYVGVLTRGTGTVRLDDASVRIDGELLTVDAWGPTLSPAELSALSMRSTSAPSPALAASEILRLLPSDVQVIGLGEGTHGTEEFTSVRADVLLMMAEQGVPPIVALEAGPTAAEALNRYIRGGPGTARDALGPAYGIWRTSAFGRMLDALRNANAVSGAEPVQIVGIDVQSSAAERDALRTLLTEFPALESRLRRVDSYAGDSVDVRSAPPPESCPEWTAAAESLESDVEAAGLHLLLDSRDADQARWYARISRQSAAFVCASTPVARQSIRDSLMAQNVLYLSQQASRSVVLWAHNAHVQRSDRSIGAAISRHLGPGYYAVGFVTAAGSVRARGIHGWASVPVTPPLPGAAVEGALLQAFARPTVLTLPTDGPLDRIPFMRTYGEGSGAGYSRVTVSQSFDALVFLPVTTAAEGLDASTP